MVTAAPDIRAARVCSMLTRLDPVIARRARRWSRMGAGDPDDLAQEGRIALLDALPKFDETRGDLEVYAGRVLNSRFGNLLRDALRWKRRPHITDHAPDGSRRSIPCPTLSIETVSSEPKEDPRRSGRLHFEIVPSPDPDPEAVAFHAERLEEIARTIAIVREKLTPTEGLVLDAYLRPSAALLVTARNLGTAERAEISQIALFLGLSHSTVDGALRRVRRLAAGVVRGSR